jgi:hypothetical protein
MWLYLAVPNIVRRIGSGAKWVCRLFKETINRFTSSLNEFVAR